MGFLPFLNHWWNLPFLVMLGLVGVFFVLQTLGLFGHSDADADADHDVDADADATPDAHVDHDAEADAEHDHDADGDHDGEPGAFHSMLAFFGVGRVPFMVIWVTLFLFCGFSGIFFNRVVFVRFEGDYPWWMFAVVLGSAFFIGLVATRLFARVAARFVDVGGKGATAKHELTGKLGVVASPRLDDKFGEIRVRDERGNEILVHGRVKAGEAPLAHGANVVLVDFDAEHELFWVTAVPELDAPAAKG